VYILLDIDGVMVPLSGWKATELMTDGFSAFSAKSVISLNNILKRTHATIVLTTSHRNRFSVNEWTQLFATRGIIAKIQKCNAADFDTRIDLVLDWINSSQEVKDFVIIDDDKSLNDLPLYLMNRVVQTSGLIGLTEDLANIAIDKLVANPE
jgi:HAD domain in Swiss Army Knife RNA repair proteins